MTIGAMFTVRAVGFFELFEHPLKTAMQTIIAHTQRQQEATTDPATIPIIAPLDRAVLCVCACVHVRVCVHVCVYICSHDIVCT